MCPYLKLKPWKSCFCSPALVEAPRQTQDPNTLQVLNPSLSGFLYQRLASDTWLKCWVSNARVYLGCPRMPCDFEWFNMVAAGWNSREFKQTRTTATTLGIYLLWLPCLFLFWLNFRCFQRLFLNEKKIDGNSWNIDHVLQTTWKWSNWRLTESRTARMSALFHIFTCAFCLV